MKEALPLVSVIIPCYNDVQFVEQSILSALGQTYTNLEVLVVDDGSDIATKEVLHQLESRITQLITQDNQGQSVARNNGVGQAKGVFVIMLDSDDYFEPTYVEEAVKVMTSSPNIKLVTCQANLIQSDGKITAFIPKGGTIKDFLYSNRALGTSMFRKIDFEACGGYDESMRSGFEDWEFFIRLLKDGGEAKVIPQKLYNYRKRTNSTTLRANAVRNDLLQYIFLKHRDLYVDNYESFVLFLIQQLKRQDGEQQKFYARIDYQIGNKILQPLRFIKQLFK